MRDYQYVAWFRDHTLPPDDQDSESVVCFVVGAADGDEARAWGDRLAADYGHRMGHEFVRSYLDQDHWELEGVPRTVAGQEVPADFIR